MATGWLGWPPATAWRSTLPEIICAMEARIEWVKMTNPFGGKEEKKSSADFLADIKKYSDTTVKK